MRALAFIMAAYILALAFMPCADNPSVHDEADDHAVVLADIGSPCGDHHHNPEDTCSPLCFCNCCHTHVNHEEAHFFFSSIQHQTVLNSFYNGRETSSFVNPPLRPPQV
ncbi:DUF6660 family protein [Owenweeksia hongkongensis]|uniref:Secreted protein n=1 Tax=Owenweeksia hongkongensis (strain DSM 17368 / CIP 108786 / JCM 12287 / NRRL B-23963 / UST20020801) TaxID=926562 RepID=G8R3J5_OWEHD|nr:DUF6660 family protein [Owenweeksia hongkongensis]AEV33051.1 hypothetical protein Oweho_2076 [Owenweeksia hongkongensis DSM 17368]